MTESNLPNVKMGDWFKLFEKSNILASKEGARLNVTIPEEYDIDLPSFAPSFAEIKEHVKSSLCNIYDYFAEIADDPNCIENINGENTKLDTNIFKIQLRCNFCFKKEYWMYSCDLCCKNMCKDCHDYHDSSNNNLNLDNIAICLEHEKQGKFSENQIDPYGSMYCDICAISPFKVLNNVWCSNRKYNKDICGLCIETETAKKLKEQYKSKWTCTFINDPAYTTIGSLLDWIPILRNDSKNAILFYNINKKSTSYHSIAFGFKSSDNTQMIISMDKPLSEVLEEINEIGNSGIYTSYLKSSI